MTSVKHICVFCGAASGGRPAYTTIAQAVGAWIAQRGLTLVYGGGNVGLMGAVADAALAHKGEVIGVIPTALVDKEVAHRHLSAQVVVRTMHERKARMSDLADAFLALPGGFGTLDELFEVITWAQLGYHRKPIAVLNSDGYYDPLLAMLDHMVSEGFVGVEQRRVLLVGGEAEALLEQILTYQPPSMDRWVRRSDL